MKKIAIQGGQASFHHVAAEDYFGGDMELLECTTFRGLAEAVASGTVDYGVMAIENSIAGSILPNYALIQEYNLVVCGEYKERIKLNFMALPGQEIKDIEKVMSHYMALLQCNDFLTQYPEIEVEKAYDTADSAKEVREDDLKGVAAIAGKRAADLYGLEILAEDIETIKQNYTRFLILSNKKDIDENKVNKATWSFELPDQVGSLAKTLTMIESSKINLTKIQSLPIIGKPEEYTFYIDCVWSNYSDYQKCIKNVQGLVHNLKILGEYESWEITT